MNMQRSVLLPLLNHVMHQEAWAGERLRPYSGARLRLEAGPWSMTMMIDAQGLFREAGGETTGLDTDVVIRLPAQGLAALLFDRKNLLSSLRLSGPADIVESLGFVFRNLRWDAEGDLAALVGDIPAHRLSLITRNVAEQTRRGLGNLGSNVSEYLREESGMLPQRSALVAFKDSLGELQADIERLEKRLATFSR